MDGVLSLLTDDAWFTMPPATLEYQGPVAIGAFLRSTAAWRGPRRYQLIPTRANGQPAYGFYVAEPPELVFRGHGMIVLTLEGDRISAITRFVDNDVMRAFGMPEALGLRLDPVLPGWRCCRRLLAAAVGCAHSGSGSGSISAWYSGR